MAKALMIQGTMSNAGKSIIVAGLCRILKQDGYRVAPFKSQNMALNSYITREGMEMGRAQAVQAQAAGIEPDVRMNPILLKPTSEMGSQVIVHGEVLKNMSAKDYFSYKRELIPEILQSYHELEKEYDYIILEGAGSPAEINLKKDDIVNMGMAEMVKAPVILAGDIDRGGVFAQLYGTIALLEEKEQRMIKGLLINKFRGDKGILEPGLKMLEEKCKKEVLGVLPYLDIMIEDEDSLSEKLLQQKARCKTQIDLAVIKFPRLSNFTDFDVFSQFPGVGIRYVTSEKELGNPDMVILPGSKNTMSDLLWMRQNGLETRICRLQEQGCCIFGICGGYQMLGEKISDPDCVEEGGSITGLGLLPVETVFRGKKKRTRICGKISHMEGILSSLTGKKIEAYEIHMGDTIQKDEKYRFMNRITNYITGEEKEDGISKGNVYGTYLHGIFDEKGIAKEVLMALAKKKNISLQLNTEVSYEEFKQKQFDLLADAMREHLDMKRIYQILEEGL